MEHWRVRPRAASRWSSDAAVQAADGPAKRAVGIDHGEAEAHRVVEAARARALAHRAVRTQQACRRLYPALLVTPQEVGGRAGNAGGGGALPPKKSASGMQMIRDPASFPPYISHAANWAFCHVTGARTPLNCLLVPMNHSGFIFHLNRCL